MKKVNVLMIGPSRYTKGGMAEVVNLMFNSKLCKDVNLKYISTTIDNKFVYKCYEMIKGFIEYNIQIKWCDVVHIHVASRVSTYRKMIYANLAKKHNKKVILHIHGGEYKKFYDIECNARKKSKIKKMFKDTDKVIVLSDEWKDYFSQITDVDKIIVMNNFVSIPLDFQKCLDKPTAVFLGMINKGKGIYDLLEVVRDIIKIYPEFRLIIGGSGEIDELNKFIENSLSKNVQYIGWVSGQQKKDLLEDSTLFILPSYNEGMPMSILEAMAYKNVCISTNVGGVPSVIENYKNGILINPGNKIELYNSIINVLADESLKLELSNNAYATAFERFNVDNAINKFEDIYKALVFEDKKGE